MKFFKYVMIVLLKMHVSGKMLDRICLKAVRDTFFFQYMEFDQGTGGLSFLVGVISNIRGKLKLFGLLGNPLNSLL